MNTLKYRPAAVLSAGLLLLGLAFAGCDNLLQEEPTSFIGPDNFYRDQADARRALAGAYNQIRQGAFGGYIGSYQITRMTDKPTAEFTGLGDHKNIMDEWRWGPAATERNVFVSSWNAAFEGINAANAVIGRVPDVPEMSQQKRDQFVAEAKFIRAFHYYMLAGWYGGVPIKRSETTELGGLEKANASEDSTYIFAINTLEEAIPDLPPDNEHGRATKTAAQTLLAKLYLQRAALSGDVQPGLPAERQIAKSGDYQAVVDLTNEVINSGKYQLPMDVVEQFNDLFWEESSEQNPEIIFDYQQDLTKGPWSGGMPNLIGSDTPSTLAAWHSNSVGQASVMFYDSMKEDGDLRAQVILLEELPKADGSKVLYDRQNYEADGYKEDVPVFRKYAKAEEQGGSQDNNDWILLRYADVLLMKAEALNEINDGPTQEAYELVNRIRERAGLDPVSGLSYEAFREEIYVQRRRELIIEGYGFHTLQRFFAIGTDRVRECSAIDAEFPRSTNFCPDQSRLQIDDPKDRLYPIPQAAFARNPRLKQNLGY